MNNLYSRRKTFRQNIQRQCKTYRNKKFRHTQTKVRYFFHASIVTIGKTQNYHGIMKTYAEHSNFMFHLRIQKIQAKERQAKYNEYKYER